MLKTIALVVVTLLVVVVGVVLAYAATKPDVFRVQRTASIKAPPEKIFPLINDFRSWGSWSPYEHKDPAMKKTFSGASVGKGAVYEWEGDKNVGSGRIEIADTAPPNKVSIKLDMIKPFAAHNQVEFRLEPSGDVTDVTWAMNGYTPYLAKVMHVFIDVDRMVGQDFEAGLASLKAIAEK
jgi:carbon monoxide dehydrogenase subunit G